MSSRDEASEPKTSKSPGAAKTLRLESLINDIQDYAIFILTPDGKVASWNLGAQRLKGYAAEEILGRHISTFYPLEEVARGTPERLLKQARETGRVEQEGWRVRKDGSHFWADVVITASFDERGQLIGYAKVTRDLTDRRKTEEALRQSEERFRLLIDSVKEYAIFMLDANGRVATWNAGAERIKGWRADEIVGKPISVFYTAEEAQSGKAEKELAVALNEGRFEEEGWRVRKDGTRFWANVILSPMFDSGGKLLGYAKVTRDLTERRRAEDERVRLAQAQEAVKLRDEFLTIVAHELRTPLTALMLHLRAATDVAKEEALLNRLARVRRGAGRLNRLVEDLLDVSRIASGRFELRTEPGDLTELTRDVIESVEEEAAIARCELRLHTAGPVEGVWDAPRVEQVLLNLVGNALKYAAGKPVDLTVGEDAEGVFVRVDDRGPGVPPEDVDRIFGRFERAAPVRHYGGLGLGLFVASELVKAHGGKIEVASRDGGGASFLMRLPKVSQPRPAVDEEGEARVSSAASGGR